MAWLSKETGRDSWKVGWREGTERRSIRLGSMSKRNAESMRLRVDELLSEKRVGGPLPPSLAAWLDSLSDDLRERFESAGLIAVRKRRTVGELVDAYRESRPNVSKATKIRDEQVGKLVVERFGKEKPIDSITRRDAEAWRQWLTTQNRRDLKRDDLADNTVRRRTGGARQIFETAVRWGWLARKNASRGCAR